MTNPSIPRLEASIGSVGYAGRCVLRDVSLSLDAGEMLAVVGKNGSGKSTLLAALSGLIPCDGRILIDGTPLETLRPRERARRVAMMIQQPHLPHITVDELLWLGRSPYRGLYGRFDAADKAAIEQAKCAAALQTLGDRYVDRLSGGEARRAYLGLLLSQSTPLMLLDEATAFADAVFEKQMLDTLARLCREQARSVVFVTHSLEQAVAYAHRVLVVDGGSVRYLGAPQALLTNTLLQDIFSVRAYRATDDAGQERYFFSPR